MSSKATTIIVLGKKNRNCYVFNIPLEEDDVILDKGDILTKQMLNSLLEDITELYHDLFDNGETNSAYWSMAKTNLFYREKMFFDTDETYKIHQKYTHEI